MSGPTPDDVRMVLMELLNQKLKEQARNPLEHLPDDYDLVLSDVLDSLGFVEMMTAMSAHFHWDLDLAGLDPENVTVVGPLCVFLSGRLQERSESMR
jgi:acyl carrier protein